MDRFLIVDGSNLLFQMFFGMPARILGAQGKAIQGTLGFVGALQKMIRRTQATHVAVLFDGEHENARQALDPDYKANREDYSTAADQDNPFSQLSDIYAALDHLNIRHAETTDCEADDWIAGYAHALGEHAEVIIASGDSDFFQLVNDRVTVFRYRGEQSRCVTPSVIRERFQIDPSQYADWKALVGDSSDHIKGAPGIGPKTAAQLLGLYGTLEGILAHTDQVSRVSTRASLSENAQKLRTNYKIIKLDGTPELPFAPEELRYVDAKKSTHEILKEIHLL